MIQNFTIILDGVDITKYHTGATGITETVGRFYNTASLTISNEGVAETALDKTIVINYGDESFSGFVFGSRKSGYNQWEIEARSNGARYTEPFSAVETTVDDATTATALCALYQGIAGVPIAYNTVDLDFGGSYERDGTLLSALSKIANVTGANYYDTIAGIVIEPNKAIGESTDHVLTKGDYFDFAKSTNTIYNKGVGIVKTSTGSINSDTILARNKIVMDVFDDGTAHIYTSPSGAIENSVGITIDQTQRTKDMVQEFTVLGEYQIETKASIKSIEKVSINGVEVTNHNFEVGYNTIYFTTPQQGYIKVEYTGYYVIGSPHYIQTPIGQFASVILDYLDQRLEHNWYWDGSGIFGDEDFVVIVEDDANIGKGFKVNVISESNPLFKVYADGVLFYSTMVFANVGYTHTATASLDSVGDGTYTYRIQRDVSVLQVTSYGRDIATTDAFVDGYTIVTFDQYYPNIEITYSEGSKEAIIPATKILGDIVLAVENLDTHDIYEFNIGNIDENDISTIPCELNQNVPIDIAKRLGLSLAEVGGVTLQVTDPSGSTTGITVGYNGILKIYVSVNGEYVIATAPLTGRTSSTITLTASV